MYIIVMQRFFIEQEKENPILPIITKFVCLCLINMQQTSVSLILRSSARGFFT